MIMAPFYILAVVGFCIAAYTYITEQKIKQNPTFRPVCDLSDIVSCSKPMKSPYANFFMISNGLAGMLFYTTIALLAYLHTHTLLILAAFAGCVVSCILGYFLYVKVKAICLLCTALYLINFLLLYVSIAFA